MSRKLSVTGVFAALLVCLSPCAPALGWHWTPPSPTHFSQVVWGYLYGFTTIDVGDEVAAFTVSGDQITGHAYIAFDGSNFGYNMNIWALGTASFPVYYLVWDGSSELSAGPGFTSNPLAYPPGAGPTQHDLGGNGVPEPPSLLIMALSLILIWLFARKRGLLRERAGMALQLNRRTQ